MAVEEAEHHLFPVGERRGQLGREWQGGWGVDDGPVEQVGKQLGVGGASLPLPQQQGVDLLPEVQNTCR